MLSCALNVAKSRDQLARTLPGVAGQLVPFDTITLSVEPTVAESELSPFTCRIPLAEDSAALLVTRARLPFTAEERELLTLIAEQVSTALPLQTSRERRRSCY